MPKRRSHVAVITADIIGSRQYSGHLVQKVTAHFSKKIDRDNKPGIPDAGRYIGWLERFLIVTFLLARHGEVIALLIGAKAVIRYPELKDGKQVTSLIIS